jgi:tRNA pseudouridine38-40 synthase
MLRIIPHVVPDRCAGATAAGRSKNTRTKPGQLIARFGRSPESTTSSSTAQAGPTRAYTRWRTAHLDIDITLRNLETTVNDEHHPTSTSFASNEYGTASRAHDAVARSYIYQIARRRTAFAKSFVWWSRRTWTPPPSPAAGVVGMHDFRVLDDDLMKSTQVS